VSQAAFPSTRRQGYDSDSAETTSISSRNRTHDSIDRGIAGRARLLRRIDFLFRVGIGVSIGSSSLKLTLVLGPRSGARHEGWSIKIGLRVD
jgi:hypothetical protein